MENFGLVLLALFINLVVTCVIVLGIYFPSQKDKAYVLTFFTLNLSIFLIATLFSQLELSPGTQLRPVRDLLDFAVPVRPFTRARNDLPLHPDGITGH